MVIEGKSLYNAIIGHLTLVVIMAVTSIYHLCMKFPIPRGVGVIRGQQYEVRMCYTVIIEEAPANSKGKRTA